MDDIINNYNPLSQDYISQIHSELKNIPLVIDSLELLNAIDNHNTVSFLELGDQYINIIENDLWRKVLYFNKEYLLQHRRDSLINLLALDSYIQAYNSAEDNKTTIIQRIANIYYNQGNIKTAKELYLSTIDDCSKNDSLKIVSTEGVIKCLKNPYFSLPQQVALEIYPLQKELLKLNLRLYPRDTSSLINSYIDLAYLGYIINDPKYVENCQNAITLINSVENDLPFDYMMATSGLNSPYFLLGDYYITQHDYKEAIKLYDRLGGRLPLNMNYNDNSIFQDVMKNGIKSHLSIKDSKVYPMMCLKKAICYQAINDRDTYYKHILEALYWALNNIIYGYDKSPEGFSERLNLYEMIFDYVCDNSDTRWAYNSVLFRKGLSNNVHIDIKKQVDSTMYNKYMQLKAYSKSNSENVYILNKMKDAERELFSIEYNEYLLPTLTYTHQDVNQTINNIDKTIAIEFAEICTVNNEEPKYIALVVRKDELLPRKIELCNISDLLTIISSNSLLQRERRDSANNHKILESYRKGYEYIWSKLEPYINEGDNVYFSPDGLLHQINIEVMQDANGKFANEKWNLHRVSSTRELCIEKPEIELTSAVLYGNLTYEMDSTAMVAQSRAYRRADSYTPTRGFVADSTMRAGWNKLPATSSEISTIRSTMQTNGIETAVYTLDEGTEESFKALSGKQTPIIHIATHGFFYKDEETKGKAFFETLSMSHNNQPDNSLKRSGLILAGAQKAWLGEPIPDDVEDGILLAEEIATMDLTGTDLVVLSACETGLGEITSEGVFGLQRAFKKAGVQTLIMSLWTVEDEATSLFMREFYKQWLGGKSRHDAFIATQKFMQNKYADPYYWAGFIMLD